MPPKRGTRRGRVVNRGRIPRGGRSARVDDRASQHDENLDNERREEEVHQPGGQNLPNTFLADLATALHNLVPQPTRGAQAREAMKEFRRLNPPTFDGESSDPLRANHWLSDIRKLFTALAINEDIVRVNLVACQLTGEANEWWESVLAARRDARRAARTAQQANEPDVEDLTWAEFENLFENQYFPDSFKDQLRDQFEKLEKGNMSVSEYALKFQSLSRFAPELVSTEERKCKRFEKGLDETLRRFVMAARITKYTDLVECARNLEMPKEESKSVRTWESRPSATTVSAPSGNFGGSNRKRQRDSFQTSQGHSTFRAPTSSGFSGNVSRPPIVCHQCGQTGHMRSQCTRSRILPPPPPPRMQTSGACFGCGGFGHIARFCPQRGGTRSETGSVQQQRTGQGSGRQQQRGTQSQTHYRQTTTVQGPHGDKGASSSTPVQGRVYTVSAAPPPPPPLITQTPESSVVRGTFLLFNSFAKVLFDSGASHSFIAA